MIVQLLSGVGDLSYYGIYLVEVRLPSPSVIEVEDDDDDDDDEQLLGFFCTESNKIPIDSRHSSSLFSNTICVPRSNTFNKRSI